MGKMGKDRWIYQATYEDGHIERHAFNAFTQERADELAKDFFTKYKAIEYKLVNRIERT